MQRKRSRVKRLGQNFLVDQRAIARILRLVQATPEDALLEIGPGRGALTRGLLAALPRAAAVEVDARLAARLRERFGSRLTLFEEDVLGLDLERVLLALDRPPSGRLLVVGNLPYAISKRLALRLVAQRRYISRAVLMFQAEVARRLTAAPGQRDYGPLTVVAGQSFRIERMLELPPEAFRPQPKVRSSVTRWEPWPDGGPDEASQARLRACLAACFSRRRRTLRNNLIAALGSPEEAARLLESAALDGALRAEALSPDDFRRLARLWPGP